MWVALGLAAGSLQVLRNALVQRLGRHVSHALNSWCRFAFNLPWAALLVAVLAAADGWPRTNAAFWRATVLTAVFQLGANLCLIAAFRTTSFRQAVVLHKLEVALSPVVGVLLFAEYPAPWGWIGILVCACGAVLLDLSGRPDGRRRRPFAFDRGSVLAILSAVGVALASFTLKDANLALVAANPPRDGLVFTAAAHTLFHATWMETVALTLWLLWREPGAFSALRTHWRPMAAMGGTAFLTSLCWFWGYTLTLVAYIKAVGQVEVLVAVAASHWALRERGLMRQLPAIALVTLGILLVLLR